ncbi:lanthionine synthetase LanC family protein [Streptomyces sp. NPDC088789]|uniref:lanthionine synthetase LanC family protein n=1 Tax=Streptomyces sp. NPDC088789 TaxID=3365899 RepID=UPI003815D460
MTTASTPTPTPTPTPAPPDPGVRATATALAVQILKDWTERREAPAPAPAPASALDPADAGVPALAALLHPGHHDDGHDDGHADADADADAAADVDSDVGGDIDADETAAVAARAVASWVRTAGRGAGHPGLFSGGLAGTLAGLRLGARVHPALHTVADRLHRHLATPPTDPAWRRDEVGITDYDLIVGPAGTLHALLLGTRPPTVPAAHVAHLTLLCGDPDLRRLRAGRQERFPQLDWLEGRVNTGMGHGVAGLLTALTATARRTTPDHPPSPARPAVTEAIRTVCRWLIRQSFTDARSVRSWDGAGLDEPPAPGARARQAWCYGAPGVSWALWDAADAVGDQESAAWAAAAFTTLCEAYDETFHLYGDEPTDRLGCCHGAAGVLAVADAFHHHAHHPGAAALRTRLTTHLTARLDEVTTLAGQDMGLLGGATGVLCALLTAAPGAGPPARRDWTTLLGLR